MRACHKTAGITILQVVLSMASLTVGAVLLMRVTDLGRRRVVTQEAWSGGSSLLSAVQLALRDNTQCTCNLRGKTFSHEERIGKETSESMRQLELPISIRLWEGGCKNPGRWIAADPELDTGEPPASQRSALQKLRLRDFFAIDSSRYVARVVAEVAREGPDGVVGSAYDKRDWWVSLQVDVDPKTGIATIASCTPPPRSDSLIATEWYYKPQNSDQIRIEGDKYSEARFALISVRGIVVPEFAPAALDKTNKFPDPPTDTPDDEPPMTPPLSDVIPPELIADTQLGGTFDTAHMGMEMRLDFDERELDGSAFLAFWMSGSYSTLYTFKQKPGRVPRGVNPIFGYACFWNHDVKTPQCFRPRDERDAYVGMSFMMRWQSGESRDLLFESLAWLKVEQFWIVRYYR